MFAENSENVGIYKHGVLQQSLFQEKSEYNTVYRVLI